MTGEQIFSCFQIGKDHHDKDHHNVETSFVTRPAPSSRASQVAYRVSIDHQDCPVANAQAAHGM
jgi:hypothetical protein